MGTVKTLVFGGEVVTTIAGALKVVEYVGVTTLSGCFILGTYMYDHWSLWVDRTGMY